MMYLGKRLASGKVSNVRQEISEFDLSTHVFVCGSTGSGKTILGKILIEESARAKIPSVIIDLKGDLSSLAIPVKNTNFFTFEKWVEARSGESKNEVLKKILYQYQKNFEQFDMDESQLEEFRNNIEVQIFTPKSSITETLSLSPLTSPPEHLIKTFKNEPEQALKLINTNSKNIISKCFSTSDIEKYRVELAFLEECIKYLWFNKKILSGREGILELIKLIKNPPFKSLAGLEMDEFISKEKRDELARQLNVLILGSNLLWFKGKAIKKILDESETSSKTPIMIFNLAFLDNFDEKNFVLTNIANEISIWMRKKVSSSDPKLLFYLDEIGAGSTSFYPAEPYSNSSKDAINILLRQGRAFGICCVLSTQNPGDIDYTGLTNCHTWFVGKLQTKEDRDKILQGISSFHITSGNLENFLKTTKTGDFAVKTKDGEIFEFKERWLLSYHKVMGERDFTILKNILSVEKIMEKVSKLIENNKINEAEKLLTLKLSEGIYENTYLLFEMAKLQLLKKNSDMTLKILDRILSIGEGDYSIWKMKAELELKKANYSEAQRSMEKLLTFMPYDLWAISQLAFCYLKLGNYEKSLYMAEKASKIDQNNSKLHFIISQCEVQRKNYINAVEAINNAIDIDLEIPEYYVVKAQIYVNLEEVEIAMDSYLRAIEIDKNCYEAYVGLAQLCIEIGNYEKAMENVNKAIIIDTDRIEAYLKLGEIYYRNKEIDKAVEVLNSVIEKAPRLHEAMYRLATIYIEKNDYDNGIKLLDKALTEKPDSIKYSLEKSKLLMLKEKYSQAIENLDKIIEVDSTFERAFEIKIEILKKLNDTEEQKNVIDELLKLNPFNSIALHANAEILEKSGDLHGALNSYKNIKKKSLDIWKKIGEINLEIEDYYSSVIAYDHLTDTVPDNIDFWLSKSKIFIKMGKYDNALDCCDKAKDINENNLEVWEIMMTIFNSQGEYNKAKFCQDKFESLGGEVKYEL